MNPIKTQCALDHDSGLASKGPALAVAGSALPMTRTERQREASRINGARSRGPRTQLGKARVRQNALVHGVYARCLPFYETPLFSPEEFSRTLVALEEEVRPQSQHARMLMERYLVDCFRLQAVLRLQVHELDPSLNRNTQQSWWYSTGRLTPTDPYRRIITVLRKVRHSFKSASENVDCTEEELSDAVDVLWQVLHHPDKSMKVRDPQATSRAEFEMLFQELQEKYKADAAKQRPRRRSGKSKSTTLDQLQAVNAASREGLLRVVCEKRIAPDGEQAFLKFLDDAIWRVERATQDQLESNLEIDSRHRGHMETKVLPRPDRMQLLLGHEQSLRRAIKEDWQLFQEALQQEARVCSQDIEVLDPERDFSARGAVINREVQLQFEALVDQAIHRQVLAGEGKVQRFASVSIVKARLKALHDMLCPPMRRRPGTTILEHDPKQDTEEAQAKRAENFIRVMRETSLPLEQGPAKDSPAETSETGQNDESGAESAQASEIGGECPSSP